MHRVLILSGSCLGCRGKKSFPNKRARPGALHSVWVDVWVVVSAAFTMSNSVLLRASSFAEASAYAEASADQSADGSEVSRNYTMHDAARDSPSAPEFKNMQRRIFAAASAGYAACA